MLGERAVLQTNTMSYGDLRKVSEYAENGDVYAQLVAPPTYRGIISLLNELSKRQAPALALGFLTVTVWRRSRLVQTQDVAHGLSAVASWDPVHPCRQAPLFFKTFGRWPLDAQVR